jgi:putative membrane-bound dehydrogenase-like protein
MRAIHSTSFLVFLTVAINASAADGNRLTYLDESDPYYVSRRFPKLVTPQWVGETDVEAVVILAIDDMRDPKKYETFLRPILRRLQQIDGRAPSSIMTNRVDPKDPQLQQWLKEGVSLETHTIDHPCPLLQKGDLARAKSTYDRCVDLLKDVPGNAPVAFRMPCCDSLNTLSPRFFSEIFNKTTDRKNFLTLDSSVFNLITANDPDLPRDWVLEADGRDRFRKYLPVDRSFVNYIEDYPYPYIIQRLCWEFPCVVPSDWEANHLHKPANPVTVRDWKAALDVIVRKQGTFNLVFHPHGWIHNEQVVDFIDYAVATYGKKVKFLSFREAYERLNKNLLNGHPLRNERGEDNGVRLIDLNNDGFLDVVIANGRLRQSRLWSPKTQSWIETDFPVALMTGDAGTSATHDTGVRFGIVRPDGGASLLVQSEIRGAWHFERGTWIKDDSLLAGLELDGKPLATAIQGRDRGVRLRDIDNDGRCELIVANDSQQAIFTWSPDKDHWTQLPFKLPAGAALVDAEGRDAGLRFVDIDEDGYDDVIMSNDRQFSLHLFTSMQQGWSRQAKLGKPGDKGAIPRITRVGANNGAWFHSRHLWVHNEDTALLKDHVDRRSFNELLESVEPIAKTPEASLRSIRVRPGFEVELVAAEPLVQSPIAFTWGPDGKFWVVEMGDYPLGVDGKGKPGGRIKYLEETKGTGKYDKATVFLDNLPFPTGVMPWGKGVLVTCAPEIFYAEDTKGTGKADLRRPLFTGFVEGNQQHRVNGLTWGIDNWIYGANGDSGGVIKSAKTGTTVDIRGRDFRFRPDDGSFDAQSGQTQYGRCCDDWGNWFGCNNSAPMYHFVLADHYLRRNPHWVAPEPRVQVSISPGPAPVYPVSRTLPRFNDLWAANRFTSACSVIVYRDELFGPAFEGNSFVSEPVHNLIHREIVTPKGVTFTSRRAADEQRSEFLASSDNWFRPTMIKTGPDGALWVADMYRHVIEHPQWIPPDWQKRLDLRAGHDKGRIYRVYPIGKRPRPIPRLDHLDNAGLVAALDSPSSWQRDLAQQLLVDGRHPNAVQLLESMARENSRAQCRLHALCTLDGLRALKPIVLLSALTDSHPGVRRHAIRLCEPFLNLSPELSQAMAKLVDDPDPQVRMQLAYTLGAWKDPEAGKLLGRLALLVQEDRFLTAAVLSSVHKDNLEALLLAVLSGGTAKKPPVFLVDQLLQIARGLGNTRALATLLNRVAEPDTGQFATWQLDTLANLLDTLDRRGSSLSQLSSEGDADVKAAIDKLAGVFTAARAVTFGASVDQPRQLAAIRLLGRGLDHQVEDIAVLGELLVPRVSAELQLAAVSALAHHVSARVPEMLLRGWKSYSPAVRSQVADVLLGRAEYVPKLLTALERKQVLPFEIDAPRRQRLVEHKNADVKKRAAKVLAGAIDPDRQKVIDSFQSVLTMKGDAVRGRDVFRKTCAACHRLDDIGQQVGPDLASVGDKSPQGLLIAILDPNRAVEARYVNYYAVTKNGVTHTGVLANETATSITLVGPDGKKQDLLRTDLDEFYSTGKSAMPDGLEKDLKPQDLADLIALIRTSGASPKK